MLQSKPQSFLIAFCLALLLCMISLTAASSKDIFKLNTSAQNIDQIVEGREEIAKWFERTFKPCPSSRGAERFTFIENQGIKPYRYLGLGYEIKLQALRAIDHDNKFLYRAVVELIIDPKSRRDAVSYKAYDIEADKWESSYVEWIPGRYNNTFPSITVEKITGIGWKFSSVYKSPNQFSCDALSSESAALVQHLDPEIRQLNQEIEQLQAERKKIEQNIAEEKRLMAQATAVFEDSKNQRERHVNQKLEDFKAEIFNKTFSKCGSSYFTATESGERDVFLYGAYSKYCIIRSNRIVVEPVIERAYNNLDEINGKLFFKGDFEQVCWQRVKKRSRGDVQIEDRLPKSSTLNQIVMSLTFRQGQWSARSPWKAVSCDEALGKFR